MLYLLHFAPQGSDIAPAHYIAGADCISSAVLGIIASMSSSRINNDDNVSEAGSISSRRSGTPRLAPIDTQYSNSGRPRPKFVSFGRDSDLGGPPNREFINESSPLIKPSDRARETDRLLKEPLTPNFGQEDDDYFPEFEETKSSFFLFLLTLGGLGLQIGWSVETSNGSVRTPKYAQSA